MAEVFAVTGYVADDTAKAVAAKGWVSSGKTVDVRPDRDTDDVFVRVSADSVREVKVGASRGGSTLVQIFLKPGASVESVIRHKPDIEGLSRFYDPALARVAAAAIANAIEA